VTAGCSGCGPYCRPYCLSMLTLNGVLVKVASSGGTVALPHC
jgi:hypothetical protein